MCSSNKLTLILACLALGLGCSASGGRKCSPTAEQCNGQDDDCDGEVDNGVDLCSGQGLHFEGGECVLGVCVLACEPGWGDCDGLAETGCEGSLSTVEQCGACGQACAFPHAGATCDQGACVMKNCVEGFYDCDHDGTNGCESDLTDVDNCGGCGAPCLLPNAEGSCLDGQCRIGACHDGYDDCDGRGENGCEVLLLDDIFNCGRCDYECGFGGPHAAPRCEAGQCGLLCDTNWADCNNTTDDGCEALLSQPDHCADCETDCPPEAHLCTGSAAEGFGCAPPPCELPLRECGDSCIDVTTDPQHCGGCDAPCPERPRAAPACEGGECAIACDPGAGDCDGDPLNGCERELNETENCGACNVECLPAAQGEATACISELCWGGLCRGGRCGDGICCRAEPVDGGEGEDEASCPRDCLVGGDDGGPSDGGIPDGGPDGAADSGAPDGGTPDGSADGGGCDCAALGGAEVGPACWFLSDMNQSCSHTCDGRGLLYDEATRTYAGYYDGYTQARNVANCGLVLDALGQPAGPVMAVASSQHDYGLGCHYVNQISGNSSDGRYLDEARETTAGVRWDGSGFQAWRACACTCP